MHSHNRPGEGRPVGGVFAPWRGHTVTEREAVEAFRTFTPEEFGVIIAEEIIHKPIVVSSGDIAYSDYYARTVAPDLRSYVQALQEDKEKQKAPHEIKAHIAQGRGDMYNLHVIVRHIISRLADVVVSTYPEQFAYFIKQPTLEEKDKYRMISEIGKAQNLNAMHLGFLAALTPAYARHNLTSPGLRPDQWSWIVKQTPDVVSGTDAPGQRLDRFINMLTMTHEDAVRIVCAQQHISYEVLQEWKTNDRRRFIAVHAAAGQYLRRNSFVGMLHAGKIYDFRKPEDPSDRTGGNTERRSCTAYAFHDHLVQGIGLALKANRDEILGMLSDPLMQINKHQRQAYNDITTTLDTIADRRAMYKTPEARQRGQNWILDYIAEEMRRGRDNPQYLAILKVAEEDVRALSIA
jgi:hypothetical protein